MMKYIAFVLMGLGITSLLAPISFAASGDAVSSYASNALNIFTLFAALFATLFLIKGGYVYITSSGNPQSLLTAKRTIRNALLGLVLVICASAFASFLSHSFQAPNDVSSSSITSLPQIQPTTSGGLAQVMIDSVVGMLQNIIQSGTKPLVTGIISFLTLTPLPSSNTVVFHFWLIMLGISDSLFVLLIALLGFHFMSASSFGFEDVDLKQVLGKIGFSFLLANLSIFLIDKIIEFCNMLISTVISSSGSIANAWILRAFDPSIASSTTTPLITLIFLLLFLILAIVLLLYYISRLIIISLGAVLSPFLCLLLVIPGTTDFAIASVKTYVITIFTVFVHIVTLELASSFLQGGKGTNSLISILISIGMFLTLLKIPATLSQMAFYSSMQRGIRKISTEFLRLTTREQIPQFEKRTI